MSESKGAVGGSVGEPQVTGEFDPYCPVCGSCGEPGCCGFAACKYFKPHRDAIRELREACDEAYEQNDDLVAALRGMLALMHNTPDSTPGKEDACLAARRALRGARSA